MTDSDVENPATSFAKWHLLYGTTKDLRDITNNAFGVMYDFSLYWNKGFPNHVPIVYNTTTFLGRMCMPDASALLEMDAVKGLMDMMNV